MTQGSAELAYLGFFLFLLFMAVGFLVLLLTALAAELVISCPNSFFLNLSSTVVAFTVVRHECHVHYDVAPARLIPFRIPNHSPNVSFVNHVPDDGDLGCEQKVIHTPTG